MQMSISRSAPRVTDGNVKWFTLAAACVALFMVILDNLVVNVALPTISRDLDASAVQLQWIVSAYSLVFASLQITAGGLGDRLGRKRWFLAGIALFTATSVMAAFARSGEMLIAARAVQGIGGAFVMPLSLSLVSAAFPPQERGKALGIWSAISVSGLAVGPIVGGMVVEYASWHWIFLINLPIGATAFLLTWAVVRESRDTSGTVAADIPGTILVTAAIAALTWGLIEAGERGWSDRAIITAFVAAAALFAAFCTVELRTERPMVPLRFFRSATFSGANIDAFVVAFLISGVAFSMTLYQQNVHGFSPVRTGLTLLPLVIAMMVGSPISGVLINRIGTSKLIAFGMLITAAGVLLFLRSGAHASYLDIVPAMVVMGIGNSLIFAPMTTAVLNSVETAKSGVASAVNGAVRETGFAFGIALLGTIMNRTYQDAYNHTTAVETLRGSGDAATAGATALVGSGMNFAGRVVEGIPGLPAAVVAQLREASAQAFVTGMDRAFILSSVVTIVAGVLSYLLIKDRVAERQTGTDAAATTLEDEAAA
jgi:EmrB/QacA subfamily drug resistance transporter